MKLLVHHYNVKIFSSTANDGAYINPLQRKLIKQHFEGLL